MISLLIFSFIVVLFVILISRDRREEIIPIAFSESYDNSPVTIKVPVDKKLIITGKEGEIIDTTSLGKYKVSGNGEGLVDGCFIYAEKPNEDLTDKLVLFYGEHGEIYVRKFGDNIPKQRIIGIVKYKEWKQ